MTSCPSVGTLWLESWQTRRRRWIRIDKASKHRIALVIALAVGFAGCAVGPDERPEPSRLDPAVAASQLPTPDGLVETRPAAALDAVGVARALFDDPSVAARVTDQGLLRAARRSWRWREGGELVVVVSVWADRQVARGLSGQAAERLLEDGGRAWTPGGLDGARGSERATATGTERRLSRAVRQNALFARSSGRVPPEVLETAIERLSRLAQADATTP